ncbi:MAG TPA: hypothetical protein VN538_12700 [Clostridia bacterium]|nr:hypothetical protein [Clostridia bacterium]
MRMFQRFSPLARLLGWLYRLGNEFTTITGGWVASAWSGNTAIWTGVAPGLTKEAAALKIDMTNTYSAGKSGVVGIANLVNLTNATTLRIKISYSLGGIDTPGSGRYQRLYLMVSDVTSGNWTSGTVYDALSLLIEHGASSVATATDVVFTLPVDTLNGNYRVYLGLVWSYQNAASWVRISEVELVP